MSALASVAFRKGHGTGNDFVVLPDPHAVLTLTPASVRALCDRRFGIGADGVLRVVPAEAAGTGGEARWFMDYWNADGSLAEMCGNGARVFARHLVQAGLEAAGEFAIGTRGGVRRVTVPPHGPISVTMGTATGGDEVEVRLGERVWPGTAVFVPNPHAVAFVPQHLDLHDLGDLIGATAAPASRYPDGVNIEFVAPQGPDAVTMRVLERGSGETLSCGTGACAAAWAHRRTAGGRGPVLVRVPGGELVVAEADDGEITLTGPVEFVAEGSLDPAWWERVA